MGTRKKCDSGFTLIELMIVIAHHNKLFCSTAQSDAETLAAATGNILTYLPTRQYLLLH